MIIHKVTKTNFSLRKLGLLWVRLTLINFLLDILISTRDLEKRATEDAFLFFRSISRLSGQRTKLVLVQ